MNSNKSLTKHSGGWTEECFNS